MVQLFHLIAKCLNSSDFQVFGGQVCSLQGVNLGVRSLGSPPPPPPSSPLPPTPDAHASSPPPPMHPPLPSLKVALPSIFHQHHDFQPHDQSQEEARRSATPRSLLWPPMG